MNSIEDDTLDDTLEHVNARTKFLCTEVFLLAAVFGASIVPVVAYAAISSTDISTVTGRLNAEAPSCSTVSSNVSGILGTPVGLGWGPDNPIEWDRAGWLVRAYGCGQGTTAVHDRLKAALDFAEPRTPFNNCNWATFNCWWIDQGINQRMLGPAMLFGGGSVASDLKGRVDGDFMQFWSRARQSESGADAIWAAFNNLYGALYFNDQTRLQTVINLADRSAHTDYGGQIMQDWSYFYHWDKINNGYGAGNANDTARYLNITRGTGLSMTKPPKDSFYEWFKTWVQWTVYKGNADPLAISKAPYWQQGYQFTSGASRLHSLADPAYSAYQSILARVKDGAVDPMGAVAYPLDSYLIARRPGFFAGLKLVSLADPNSEASSFAPFLGAVNIVTPVNSAEKMAGNEIQNHPHQLLGLLTTNAGEEIELYRNGDPNFKGNRPPIGSWGWYGVSTLDGYWGIAAESLNWGLTGGSLDVEKAWFMFDDEVLSTATGNTSDAGGAQTWLMNFKTNSTVAATSLGAKTLPTTAGSVTAFTNPTWVHTNGNGYAFLRGESVKVKAVESGYARIFADHGSSWSSAVAVLPGKDQTFTANYAAGGASILELESAAHVVKDMSSGVVGAAVFSSVNRAEIALDKPGYVLYRPGTTFSLSLTNPHLENALGLSNPLLGQGFNPKFDVHVSNPTSHTYSIAVPYTLTKASSCSGCNLFLLSTSGGRTTLTVTLRVNRKFEFTTDSSYAITSASIGLNDAASSATVPPPPGPPPSPPASGNVAPLATASASSEQPTYGQTASKSNDEAIDGFPGDYTKEWVTSGQTIGAWLKLMWSSPVTIDRAVLYDRKAGSEHITGGTLTFGDGSSAVVPSLTDSGGPTSVAFSPRTVSTLTFTVGSVSPTSGNIGLMEIEVFQPTSTVPPPPPPPGVNGDLNGDSRVDIIDLGILLSQWNADGSGDLNGDNRVDIIDLGILLANWT